MRRKHLLVLGSRGHKIKNLKTILNLVTEYPRDFLFHRIIGLLKLETPINFGISGSKVNVTAANNVTFVTDCCPRNTRKTSQDDLSALVEGTYCFEGQWLGGQGHIKSVLLLLLLFLFVL